MKHKSTKNSNIVSRFFRVTTIHLSIFGLLIGPLPIIAAEQTKTEKETDGWKAAQSLLGQFTQTYATAIQSQAAMQQQASLLQQLQVQPIRSKYFPNCQLAPMTPSPKGVCDSIADSNTLQMARFYQQMADRNIDMYEKLGRDGGAGKIVGFNQGETYLNNSGISCLRQNQALVDSQLQDKLNYLEGLKAKIDKQAQLFKEQNQNIIDGMKDVNSELNGGGETADDQNRNFSTMLKGSKCSEFLPSEVLSGKKAGFRGMTAFMEKSGKGGKSLKAQASFMIKDQGKIKTQLENNISNITNLIKKNGVSGYNPTILQKINKGSIKFGKSLTDVLETEIGMHVNNYNSVKEELSQIKDSKGNAIYTDFPQLDRNFTSRVAEVNPRNLIKNSLVEDCITFNDTLKMDQILGSLRHQSLGNKGTTIIRLRDELSKVIGSKSAINSSSFIEDKLNAIKKIDDTYGSGKITVKLDSAYFGNSAAHGYTPYELYANIYKQCEQKYESGQLDNGKKQRVENALKRLNEFKNEERVFASELANKLSDQVLNCSSTGEAASGSCSEDSLSTTSENFCLSTAVSCAQNVNSCYQRIENEITTRVNKMKTFAVQYNTNVEKYIAAQEAYYNQLKSQFSQETGVLKNFFQGANFSVIEKDKLFVEMPKLELNKEFGLQMRDPSMEFTKNLPKAIDSLKRMMAEQKQTIAKKIEEHVNDQKDVLSHNIEVWRDISSTCKSSEQNYVTMVNKKNEEMGKAYKEQEQTAQTFCRNYDNMRRSRVPGCGDDNSVSDLMEEGNKVAARINPDVFESLGQYKDYCNQYGGDKNKEGDEVEDESPVALQICDKGDGKFEPSDTPKSQLQTILEDMGYKVSELSDIDTTTDEFKKRPSNEKNFIKKLQDMDNMIGSEYCKELKKSYHDAICDKKYDNSSERSSCKNSSTTPEDFGDDVYKKYAYNEFKKGDHPNAGYIKALLSYAKKAKGAGGNALWVNIGEQATEDCTANNNIQGTFKNAMNDIMALQKGMMQSQISQ